MATMTTRSKYNIAAFHDHYLQSILALFLTNAELYKDHHKYKHKQDYFFGEFGEFAAKYYHFSGDESVYFGSVRKQAAGEANICGGAGKQSGASSRYFKNRYHDIEESREKRIDDFAQRYYGAPFDPSHTDPRLFLGVTEIWNKLDRALEVLAASKWSDVRERSYDDVSGTMPLPKKLDKMLVPIDMRNIVMQQWRNAQSKSVTKLPSQYTDVDEEEREFLAAKTAVSAYTSVDANANPIVFVVPEGLDEEEW